LNHKPQRKVIRRLGGGKGRPTGGSTEGQTSTPESKSGGKSPEPGGKKLAAFMRVSALRLGCRKFILNREKKGRKSRGEKVCKKRVSQVHKKKNDRISFQ